MELEENIVEVSPQQHFAQVVNAIYPLSDSSMAALVNHSNEVTKKKKYHFYKEGEVADKIYFIHKGVIRVCYYQQEKLVVDRFEKEGYFFGGNMSYMTNQPVEFDFETLEPCVLLEFSSSDFKQLCKDYRDIQHMHSIFLSQHFKRYADLVTSFRGLSPNEKYNRFLKIYGNLIHRITLKNVAAFLGVKHETLSRIRSKLNSSTKLPVSS